MIATSRRAEDNRPYETAQRKVRTVFGDVRRHQEADIISSPLPPQPPPRYLLASTAGDDGRRDVKSASHAVTAPRQFSHQVMARLAATTRDALGVERTRLLPSRSNDDITSVSRSLALILFVVLTSLCITTSAVSTSKCLTSLPPHRFDPKPPRPSTTLTFCKEYSGSTCCNASHTQYITRQLYPYFSTTFDERDEGYGVSDECRQLAASLHCSTCHPLVGTGQLVGVCRESCDALYSACAPSLFEHVNGLFQPCSPSTLVCSELSAFVRSGEELCRHLGLVVGSSSPAPSLPSPAAASSLSSSDLHSAFTSFLSATSHSTQQPTCFHASSSPSSLNSPTTKRTTTKPTTTSTATPTSSPYTTLTSTLATLTTLLTTLPARLTTLPTTVAQWRKWARKWMRSHMSSGVSVVVLVVGVVGVMFWPRIRSWLNQQRWKARLTADGIRRQRMARLGNNR